jgi:uncharacterized protein (DUF427 family)
VPAARAAGLIVSNQGENMPESSRLAIHSAEGTWVIRAGGAVLGETSRALELVETGRTPVIYFPPEDLAMAFFEKSETRSTCPLKGEATYWNIVAKSGTIPDVGWSYENPKPEAARIAGHISFYDRRVMVEQV